ncbi:hypothetical protein DL93DRAFT_2170891 [Clavulina sp. PMI_390]|nr:hypothetical protein DL93DRAFT_2170891 [Clavulina sp. PMI_390]
MNKRATNFDAGLSACGPTYSPSDFVVALAQNTFGYSYPSPYCNRPIVLAYNGKTAHAKIVDSCELCAQYDPHALDLTDGLFAYFAPIDIGVIYIDWSFTDEGNPDPATTTHHTTTTTRHTTSTKPTTTSHSTTTTKSTSSQASTASHTTSTASSTSSAPTGSATGNFDSVAEVILNLQNVMNAAAA